LFVRISPALFASILVVATGCDKPRALGATRQSEEAPAVRVANELNLSAHPNILFQVFGEVGDPRMVPVAVIDGGALHQIDLSAESWKRFDEIYLRPSQHYALYHDGAPDGSVDVRRGMWEPGRVPFYSLPGCQTLTPVASVALQRTVAGPDYTLQYLAANSGLARARGGFPLPRDELDRIAHAMAMEAAPAADIPQRQLDSLDMHAVSFPSGTTRWPTIVATFIDATAENTARPDARTAHMLIVADADSGGRYRPSYVHRVNGPLAAAEFRRYYDHLDLTGDGIDEIVLEGWRFGGDTFLTVLQWKGDRWEEVFRGKGSWCLDSFEARSGE
jgi:hypothetical protein